MQWPFGTIGSSAETAGEGISVRLGQPSWTGRIAGMMLCMVALGCLVGCGGGSYGSLGPNAYIPNLTPTIASLNPSSAVAGGAAFTLTVTGTNFSSPTVQWNGSPRPTTYVSSTELQAAITASDIATPGTAQVSVSTSGPAGSGMTGALIFTIDNPVPTTTSLTPSSAVAGGAAFTLTVTGTNFVPSSTVQWNGSPRTTTFVSSTSLRAAISASDIATGGTDMVTVSTSAPGGGTSGPLPFSIAASVPAITLMNPSSAVAGSLGFTLTVTGTEFVSSSVVHWNGSPRTTTFGSSTQLQAAITAADISSIGTARVTVANPPANGGNSAASTFFIGSTGGPNFAVIAVNQAAQDIVFDQKNQLLYLSVTGTAATHPNTISVLDPATGTITSSQPAGSNPNVLAISDDSQLLYAGIDGSSSVQRFTLPGLAKDISYSLGSDSFGPNFALDLQVAPGGAHTTAVTLGNVGVSPSADGGIVIFDDATARPTKAAGFPGTGHLFDSLQWGSDATALFAANNEDTGFDFYTLSVNSSGVMLNQDFGNRFGSFSNKIHFDVGTKLIYGDNGQIVDPNGIPAGNFNTSGVMVPDSSLNTAFFASSVSNPVTIESFDLTHFTAISSITIPNVTGGPIRLIRWGQNGLAFNTSGGQVFLVGGNFISPAPPLTLTPPPIPTPPPTPAPNAPTIALLNPSSTFAGGSGFTLNVTGTKFDPAAIVHVNGTPLTTTFVSSTQLMATITAANISTAGTAKITVANPLSNGGVSAPSTFLIGSTAGISSGGTGFAVITVNQAAKDVAFDPLHGVIYLSVPGTVAGIGNTVSVLDPSSATVTGSAFAGSNPNALAISDDGQFLYSAIDGSASVQRFTLPALASDVKYSLGADSFFGPFSALDLQVAPGAAHTTAVTLANVGVSPSADGGITIFDDATARPTRAKGFGPGGGGGVLYDSLQWGSDATALFAANYEDTGFDFYTLSVTPSGVMLVKDYPNTFSSFRNRIHFDAGTKLVYAEDGHVVDPSTGLPVGSFNTSGPMAPDSNLNKAFFLTGSGSPTITITSFDLKLFTKIDSITVNNVTGNARRLIRWGQNGLAFNTDGGQVILIGGNFVH